MMKKYFFTVSVVAMMGASVCFGGSDRVQKKRERKIQERQQDIQRNLLVTAIAESFGCKELAPEKKVKFSLVLLHKQEKGSWKITKHLLERGGCIYTDGCEWGGIAAHQFTPNGNHIHIMRHSNITYTPSVYISNIPDSFPNYPAVIDQCIRDYVERKTSENKAAWFDPFDID